MSNSRRSCEVRTSRTHAPLQARTLLNDETYLKASQTLASLPLPRIFKKVLHLLPDASETAIVKRQFQTVLKHHHANPKDPTSLLRNLDEAITHE